MSLRSALIAAERAQRQEIRATIARQREFERLEKARAKASLREQGHLEVEAFEARIASLVSIHRECGPIWDWKQVVARIAQYPLEVLDSKEQAEARARNWQPVLPRNRVNNQS